MRRSNATTRRSRWPSAAATVIGLAIGVSTASAAEFRAGGLLFSDRLSGMELVAASGAGTRSDPIVIVERLTSLEPATLTVRRFIAKPGATGKTGTSLGRILRIYVQKIVINATGRAWAGFDLELQEELGAPSEFGDGLSFDQVRSYKDILVRSDKFDTWRLAMEPHDRVHFRTGSVDPGSAVSFFFAITDVSPSAGFYLYQQPLYLTAEAITVSGNRPSTRPTPPP